MSEGTPYRIAVIGDIHKSWSDFDVEFFNRSDYDLVLFVGDLPGRTHRGTLDVARHIARVQLPALLIPGNHDGVSVMQLIGELQQNQRLIERSSRKQESLCEELEEALRPVQMCGYSIHRPAGSLFDLIAARPHSMGGPHMGFRPHLKRKFGVESLTQSKERLRDLVDQCGPRIIFLAHNGPKGLGAERNAIWGCDFRSEGGDFGDADLEAAISHARKSGKQVLAVIAGHMHHRVRGLTERPWRTTQSGTLYINAARVPRIFRLNSEMRHHHIAVEVSQSQTEAREELINPRASSQASQVS